VQAVAATVAGAVCWGVSAQAAAVALAAAVCVVATLRTSLPAASAPPVAAPTSA